MTFDLEILIAVLGCIVMALVVTGCFTGGFLLLSQQDEMLRREAALRESSAERRPAKG